MRHPPLNQNEKQHLIALHRKFGHTLHDTQKSRQKVKFSDIVGNNYAKQQLISAFIVPIIKSKEIANQVINGNEIIFE